MSVYKPDLSGWPTHGIVGSAVPVVFNQATAANHAILAAVTGKKHRIVAFWLYVAGAQTLTFTSSTGDEISDPAGANLVFEFPAAAVWSFAVWSPMDPPIRLESDSGAAIGVTLSAAQKVRGVFWIQTL